MRNRRFKVTDVAAPDEDNPALRMFGRVPVMVYAAADHRISVHG